MLSSRSPFTTISPPKRVSSRLCKRARRRIVCDNVSEECDIQGRSIDDLSDDLLIHIMEFFIAATDIDVSAVYSISSVSRRWHESINNISLWSKMSESTKCSDSKLLLVHLRRIATVKSLPDAVHVVISRSIPEARALLRQSSSPREPHVYREAAIAHQLLGDDLMKPDSYDRSQESRLMLPLLVVETNRSHMFTWLHHSDVDSSTFDRTLQDWLDDLASKAGNKTTMPPCTLPVSLACFQAWCRDLLLALHQLSPRTPLPPSLQKTSLEPSCTRASQLHPQHVWISSSGRLRLTVIPNLEMSQVGRLLALLARGGLPLTHETTTIQPHDIPALKDDGVHFLQLLCSNQSTPLEALQHEFLMTNALSFSQSFSQPAPMILDEDISDVSLTNAELKPSPRKWALLVDWLAEVALVFDLHPRTVHRAMAYFDTVIQKSCRIDPKRYQLLAGTCLYLANRLEATDRVFSKQDVAFSADNSFSLPNIEVAERFITRKLEWRLAPTTLWDACRQELIEYALSDHASPILVNRVIHVALMVLQAGSIRRDRNLKSMARSCLLLALRNPNDAARRLWQEVELIQVALPELNILRQRFWARYH